MSSPAYAYRPSKAVTRHMVVQMIAKLAPVAHPSDYHYVGFGALEFIDFELAHRTLGIKQMTSIEQDGNHLARYEANRPYSNIALLAGTATQQLPNVKWTKHNAVWLDYECQLNSTVINDVTYLLGKLNAGDFLCVTLNAVPAPYKTRRPDFAKAVTEARVPAGTDDDTLGEWGWAKAQQTVLFRHIRSELRRRAGHHTWRQLLNIEYRDDALMQVIAGVIEVPALTQTLDLCGFDRLDFHRPSQKGLRVEVPYLTHKERRHLNERLPRKQGGPLALPGVDKEKVTAYADLYRYLDPTGT